jgi:L-ribulose-5-phosphate 3-epimerase
MQLAICHYSFHRHWQAEGWDATRLARVVRDLGVPAIDFHAGLLGKPAGAVAAVRAALADTGLALAGFSLSTDFNREPAALAQHVEDTRRWLGVAAELGAPVCRVFGGNVDRRDPAAVAAGLQRVIATLRQLAPEAAKLKLILALENHGGLPCTAEEQVRVIEAVSSPALRATVDIGNYTQGGQRPLDGTRIAAPYAAYVHLKDVRLKPGVAGAAPQLEGCVLGRGDADVTGCLAVLAKAGYCGSVAVEYEAAEDELSGVAASVAFVQKALKKQSKETKR